jgi:hypothetical protein
VDTALKISKKSGLAFGADFHNRFALVGSAVRANVVSHMILIAVFAANQVVQGERIMRTTTVASAD